MIDTWKENDNQTLYIQLEKCPSDLTGIVTKDPLSETEIIKVLKDLTKTLVDLHSKNIAHIDIKPGNL